MSPVYWALEGIRGVIAEGDGLTDVLVPAAVLFAIAGAAAVLALWRYQHDEPQVVLRLTVAPPTEGGAGVRLRRLWR